MTRRIIVIADTHMPHRARSLPSEVLHAIGRADMVIHLGDFTEMRLVEELRGLAPLEGVHGNNDSQAVKAILPLRRDLEVEGRRIVLIHGHVGGRTALAVARSIRDVDAVLFGHSHQPRHLVENGILLFNPGSPTDRRWAPSRTYGVVSVGEEIEAQHVALP